LSYRICRDAGVLTTALIGFEYMTEVGPPDTPGWTIVGGRAEGDLVPDLPADLWQLRWRDTGRSIRLADPLYGNQRTLSVAEVATNGGTVTFAVTEVSNGVYLFALPGIR
jgi:hypothetical protein